MAEKQRQQDEARHKADAEAAEKKQLEDEARHKAETDLAAEKKTAEAAENALRLTLPDRQHVQVALSALDSALSPPTALSAGARAR